MSANIKSPPNTPAKDMLTYWQQCKNLLKEEIDSQPFTTWLSPLEVGRTHSQTPELLLLAPNRFVAEWVNDHFLSRITELLRQCCADGTPPSVRVKVSDTHDQSLSAPAPMPTNTQKQTTAHKTAPAASTRSNVNRQVTFDNFVEGKSNQMARAAALTVSENPGEAYNPLLIYGGVGLGKTHLMHAVGNVIAETHPKHRILYIHSERFVADMIRSLQRNAMNEFKRHYRNVNLLLIDDIQFFAGKDRSQEEFFHTFNALLDGKQQIILTCDRYPKEIEGLEERLRSRFGWGLTVAIEPPELETRVAILITKAEQMHIQLPQEVAFFIAKNIQSNVRELEGALKRVVANAQFTGRPLTLEFARDALKDLLTLQAKLVSIDNIQRTVANYYKLKMVDLLSKRRNRSLARPRQMAMSLAKELTNHSLPEIGAAFSGRDHTTVLHACRKIKELLTSNIDLQEDWKNLIRILSA